LTITNQLPTLGGGTAGSGNDSGSNPVPTAPSENANPQTPVTSLPKPETSTPVIVVPTPETSTPVIVVPTPTETTTVTAPPVVKGGPLESTLTLNVYFDMGSSKVYGSNLSKLQDLATKLSGLGKEITISITGYAQPTPGSEATDGKLSEDRAAAVAKILRQFGVTTKVIYKGAGRATLNVPSSRYVEIVAANS
jgi:outer membrane protein OmpA-like peptidoglycan-associated protein